MIVIIDFMIVALGILANLIFIVGAFVREPKHGLTAAFLGNIIYVIYYYLLEMHAPLLSLSLGALTCLIIAISDNKNLINILAFVNAVIITCLLCINMSSAYDTLIIGAAWAIALAQMNKSSYINYKLLVCLSQGFWITYSVHFTEYAMLFTSGFILTTCLFSLTLNMHKDGLIKIVKLNFYLKLPILNVLKLPLSKNR